MPEGVILPPTLGPLPRFTFVPSAPAAAAPVQFDASTSCGGPLTGTPPACPASAPSITSYSWNFGDGQTGSGQTASHAFALQQTYTVTLTVTNELGASNSISLPVTVAGGALPSPLFSFSPTDIAVGQLVFFSGLSSTPGQGHTIAAYRWTFGDGTTGSGATVSHAYAAAGVYKVQLTVVDEAGQSRTSDFQSLTVGPAGNTNPIAVFTYSPASPVPVGTTVRFDASPSTGTAAGAAPVIYQWQFDCLAGVVSCGGPVTTTTSPIITKTYTLQGTFNVVLTVFDTAGRSNAVSHLITVQ
jgi:PKD repeat protein